MNNKQKLGYMVIDAAIMAIGSIIGAVISRQPGLKGTSEITKQ